MATEGSADRMAMREAIMESLMGILSPHLDTRTSAEEHMKTLEITDEFGFHLVELTVDQNGQLPVRILSSVLLRQYIENHWFPLHETFRAPEVPTEIKAIIRQMLLHGLADPLSKIRVGVAYAISKIVNWDWPEAWPELFDTLMQALNSGNGNLIHGAMRVLTEFSREVTDTQIPRVAPVILPQMLKIYSDAETHGVRTRSRAVSIFNTCAEMIAAMNQLEKGTAKKYLFPILPQFIEHLAAGLQVPDGQHSDCGLKMEVLKALTNLVKNFPKTMIHFSGHILGPVWSLMTQNADSYVKMIVYRTEESEDPVDSDGEVLGFENLIQGIFEFVSVLLEHSKFFEMVRKSADQLLYYIIFYLQITEDQASAWAANPDQFVEDEDCDSYSSSVRASALDLLLSLSERLGNSSVGDLCAAVDRHLNEVDVSSNPHWLALSILKAGIYKNKNIQWKMHEACFLALGSVKKAVIEVMKTHEKPFDLETFLRSYVLVDLFTNNISPFLIGRCLWMASRYSSVTSQDMTQRFVEATVNGIQPSQPPCVRISSIRALYEYCTELEAPSPSNLCGGAAGEGVNVASRLVLKPHISLLVDGVIALATEFQSEVLTLCLETLVVIITIDEQFTAEIEHKVSPLAIAVLLKQNIDPLVISLVQDIFTSLARNPQCNVTLQERLVPTLHSILQSQVVDTHGSLQPTALEILTCLVRHSAHPLPSSLIHQMFPAAVSIVLHTDDNSAMQAGGECVRAYVAVAMDEISQWHDDQGRSGVYYVGQVIFKLLDPKTSEFTACFVGRLISLLIAKMGTRLGEDLDQILRAVLSKLQLAETPTVIQSLVLVFAQLVHCQLEAVLDFLSSVPSPTGKPALEFVLVEWCSKQPLFFGEYDRKVSSVALCKLLHYALVNNDQRLTDIQVQGDLIATPASLERGVKTRSKAAKAPDQWTTVPVLVKIYKLLINELSNRIEMQQSVTNNDIDKLMGNGDDDNDDDDDDDDNGVEESEDVHDKLVSAILNEMGEDDDEEEEDEDDDPDAAADPINEINLQKYLTEFLQQLSQLPCYSLFAEHHNESEKKLLAMIGINV